MTIGVDGQVIAHCYARQCDIADIVRALGLQIADLYPAGHRQARRRALPSVSRSDLKGNVLSVAQTLAALDRVGRPWQLTLGFECPYCAGPAYAWLRVAEDGPIGLDCLAGCTANEVAGSLAGLLLQREGDRGA
ncbi:MAG: hypothetical protein REI11_08015 [Patulibacter sp.]|nr:hypothetical protein [Patulibacter sp.]